MKLKSLIFTALATVALASCSDEEKLQGGNVPGEGDATQSYLSLNMKMPTGIGTREASPDGSDEESMVKTAIAILFNGNSDTSKVLDVRDLGWTGAADATLAGKASDSFPVDPTTTHILVVVNPNAAININEGQTLATIKNAIALTDTEVAAMSTDNNFMMNNVELVHCAGKIKTFNVSDERTNTVDKLKALAVADPIVVAVDRAVAKVTLEVGDLQTSNGAKVTIESWRINVTNKKLNLLPTPVVLPSSSAKYYKDANYDNNTTLNRNYFDEYKVNNNFNAFKTVKDLYCTENTMKAEEQIYAYTTQVVLEVKYFPKDITDSWLRFEGKAYTFAAFKTAYDKATAGSTLKAAGDTFAKSILGDDKTFNDVEVTDLNADISETVKESGIDYFYKGICYYKVMIRHDQDNKVLMSLGRYGVVRNNWYTLTVKSILQPGLSYLVDPVLDAEDETKVPELDTTLDDVQNYLSVQIKVNPWTMWNQGVEL